MITRGFYDLNIWTITQGSESDTEVTLPHKCWKAAAGWNLTERVIKLWLQEVFTIWLFSLRRQLKSTAHFKSRNLHPERMISYDDRTGFYAWILKKQEWVPWHNIQCLKFYHRSYRNLKNGVVSNGTLSLPVKYMTGDKSDGKLIFPTNTTNLYSLELFPMAQWMPEWWKFTDRR